MIFDMPSCGGCRTCEMACSFKHKGEFIPEASSIKILEKEKGIGFLVSLQETTIGDTVGCDGCEGLNLPLCIQYCKKKEELENILKEFILKMGKIRACR